MQQKTLQSQNSQTRFFKSDKPIRPLRDIEIHRQPHRVPAALLAAITLALVQFRECGHGAVGDVVFTVSGLMQRLNEDHVFTFGTIRL